MRAMRRTTVSAYTPDGSWRIDAIAQIDGSYKPIFDVSCFDYEWDASLSAFVMWPKGSIRILMGTEKEMNKRRQKVPKFTPEEHERLMNRMVELMVDDIYRNRSEKIKVGVEWWFDTLGLPEECLGIKEEIGL